MVNNIAYLAALLVTLSACGNNMDGHPIAFQVEEVRPHIEKFSRIYNIDVAWIEVRFSNELDKSILGQCISWSDGRREIEIDKESWFENTDAANEQLIFHELGHCALDRDHHDDLIEYDTRRYRPASIMHAYAISHSIYSKFRYEYVSELHHVVSYDQ